MVSPRIKFIAITIDELLLVPLVIAIVYYFAPEWAVPVTVIMVIGAAVFVAGKYYLVYPSLLEGSYMLYDLEGMTGKVIDTVTSKSGKIKVRAEIWDARCESGEIPIGAMVRVLTRESMRVHVEPIGMQND
ncbi:MAG: NfeD family protein [Candidatus Thorarchaeota archaeon]|jgi:membrane protein implicated in regulation of membrane protease activity